MQGQVKNSSEQHKYLVSWVVQQYFEGAAKPSFKGSTHLKSFLSSVPQSDWTDLLPALIANMQAVLKRIPHEECFCHRITEDFVELLFCNQLAAYPALLVAVCECLLLYHQYNGSFARKVVMLQQIEAVLTKSKIDFSSTLPVVQVWSLVFTQRLGTVLGRKPTGAHATAPRIAKDKSGKLVYVLPPSDSRRLQEQQQCVDFANHVAKHIDRLEVWWASETKHGERDLTKTLVVC